MQAQEPQNDSAVRTLKLPDDLGIEYAGTFKEQLLEALDEARPVQLDGSTVGRIHTASVQLLAAFCAQRRQAGHSTQWQTPSALLKDAITTLGLEPALELSGALA